MEVGVEVKKRVPPMPKFKPPPLPEKPLPEMRTAAEMFAPPQDILKQSSPAATSSAPPPPPPPVPAIRERRRIQPRDINGNSNTASPGKGSNQVNGPNNVSDSYAYKNRTANDNENKENIIIKNVSSEVKSSGVVAATRRKSRSSSRFSAVTKLDDSLYLSSGSVRSQRITELRVSLIVNARCDEDESPIPAAVPESSTVPATESVILNDPDSSRAENLIRCLDLLTRIAKEIESGGIVLVLGRDSFSTALICMAYFVLHENATIDYGLVMLRLKWPKANLPEEKLRAKLKEMAEQHEKSSERSAIQKTSAGNDDKKTLLTRCKANIVWFSKYFFVGIVFFAVLVAVLKKCKLIKI